MNTVQAVLEVELRGLMRRATRADRLVGSLITVISRTHRRALRDRLLTELMEAQKERDTLTGAYQAMAHALSVVMRHRFGQPP